MPHSEIGIVLMFSLILTAILVVVSAAIFLQSRNLKTYLHVSSLKEIVELKNEIINLKDKIMDLDSEVRRLNRELIETLRKPGVV